MFDLLQHAEHILRCALTNGGDFAEIFFEERAHCSFRFDDNKVERVVSGAETGIGIRVLIDNRTVYAHTNDLRLDKLVALAKTVAEGAHGSRGSYAFDFKPMQFAMPVKQPPQTVSTADKLRLAAAADHAARTYDPRVVQVTATYADSLRKIVVANSEGRFVEDVRSQVYLAVQVVAKKDALIQTGYHPIGGTVGYELFDTETPESAGRDAARQACLMLDADPAPAGRMPVVLSSEAGGTLVHEAVGHGLEADLVEKGISKYGSRLGDMIAAPEVTIIDDGSLPGKRGSANIDDEGTPTQRTVLVDNGRLAQFMTNIRTARILEQPITGNGRRQSYEYKPIPRMTNTLIASGTADPADILASTPRGLFVKRMGGGQVNPLNGDFVFEVSEGYRIENGTIGAPVRGATLIGNGPDTLLAIEAVGSDLGFAIGTCGKDGQGAPVTDAQPTLRLRELTIGGTQT